MPQSFREVRRKRSGPDAVEIRRRRTLRTAESRATSAAKRKEQQGTHASGAEIWEARGMGHVSVRLGFQYFPAFGLEPFAPAATAPEPAETSRPSGSFTVAHAARCVPSFARKPFTVTTSPGFKVFLRQPWR